MNNLQQVDDLVSILKAGGVPLSDAVFETAKACIGWPYVFGAWGEQCTPSGRKRRKSDEHPTIVSACQVLREKNLTASCAGCKWDLPVRMYDCRGFTDWCLKQFGIDLVGEGATSQWDTESNWVAKGEIADCPDDILVCLFVRKNGRMQHTGLGYKGETVECSSGVQHFTKRNKKWTHWAIPKGIDGTMPDIKPTLKKGSKGEYVTLLQTTLLQRGYDIGKTGVDGSFGKATDAAVKAFQKDQGLTADGIVGRKTWEALDASQAPRKLYTVVIPNRTREQAEALLKQYPGTMTLEE